MYSLDQCNHKQFQSLQTTVKSENSSKNCSLLEKDWSKIIIVFGLQEEKDDTLSEKAEVFSVLVRSLVLWTGVLAINNILSKS